MDEAIAKLMEKMIDFKNSGLKKIKIDFLIEIINSFNQNEAIFLSSKIQLNKNETFVKINVLIRSLFSLLYDIIICDIEKCPHCIDSSFHKVCKLGIFITFNRYAHGYIRRDRLRCEEYDFQIMINSIPWDEWAKTLVK